MPPSTLQDFSLTMIAPRKGQCGISDYTDYLMDALYQKVWLIRRIAPERYSSREDRADVIHIQHQYFLFGGVAPWKNRCSRFLDSLDAPVALTAHEFLPPDGNPLRSIAIRITNRSNFMHPCIKRLIVHTSADRSLMALFGIPKVKVQLIRHGVPPPPNLPPSEEAKRACGLENRFVVTIFGFLSRKKGYLDAIEALPSLPRNISMIFGGGKHPDDDSRYVEEIAQEISARGLNDRVRITGYLNRREMSNMMAATDLILAPFHQTSGSGSLAMAFACAKPIVASDIPPNMEYLEDVPECIRVFPLGDLVKMESLISTLALDPTQREALSLRSREYALKRSYSNMADETVALYRTLLSEA